MVNEIWWDTEIVIQYYTNSHTHTIHSCVWNHNSSWAPRASAVFPGRGSEMAEAFWGWRLYDFQAADGCLKKSLIVWHTIFLISRTHASGTGFAIPFMKTSRRQKKRTTRCRPRCVTSWALVKIWGHPTSCSCVPMFFVDVLVVLSIVGGSRIVLRHQFWSHPHISFFLLISHDLTILATWTLLFPSFFSESFWSSRQAARLASTTWSRSRHHGNSLGVSDQMATVWNLPMGL